MTENASPKPAQRPTLYPAAIPRTMTTKAQREAIDLYAQSRGIGKAEALRELIDEGLKSISQRDRY